MIGALQQRPEIITKLSGQISGMGQMQAIEVLNVKVSCTGRELLELIQRLDSETLSADDLSEEAMRDPTIANADGQGLSPHTTLRLNLPVSDKMLSTLGSGGLEGMEEWYFRPDRPRADRGDLPGVAMKPTDGSRKALALLRAAGMPKVQIEQLVRSELNRRLERTEAAGTVVEVFFYDTKDRTVVDEKRQVRNIRGAVDFAELGRGLITLKNKEHESFVIQHLASSALDFTLGDALGVPALDQFRFVFPIVRRFSGKHRAELAQTYLHAAEERAKAFLMPGAGAMMRVQAQLHFDYKDGMRYKAFNGTSRKPAEEELKSLLGGAPLGILTVAMSQCPDSLKVQWNDEISIYVQGTDLTNSLIDRLRAGIRAPSRGASTTTLIKLVKLEKNSQPSTTTITQRPAAGAAARPASKALATVADLEAAIVQGVFGSDQTVMFPANTSKGEAIVWAPQPATTTEAAVPQTTMEQLPAVCPNDGFRDLREVLSDTALEYTAAVLLQALMNLMTNKSLVLETSDDESHYLLFSTRKYPAQTKRRRGEGDKGRSEMSDEEPDDDAGRRSAQSGFGGTFRSTGGGAGAGAERGRGSRPA
jgi:hypothetical protein